MIAGAFRLWAECAREAGRAVVRSPMALLALVMMAPFLALVNFKISPHLGLMGGFLMGLLQAGAAGWYLALVDIAVAGRRTVTLQDLLDEVGSHASEVMGVMFVFFVLSLLFQVVASGPLGLLLVVLVPALALAFNPTPEMIVPERTTGTELLGEAFRFVRANAFEWIVPQLAATLVLGAVDVGLGRGGIGIAHLYDVLMTFGPFFGFIRAGGFADTIGADPRAIVSGVVSVAFVHAFMVFRAVLYRALRGSNRRGRAWAGRSR